MWYEIIEVKADDITKISDPKNGDGFIEIFEQVMEYKRWLTKTRAEIPLQVHTTILAHSFSKKVIEKAKEINKYLEYHSERGVRLIEYKFNKETKK